MAIKIELIRPDDLLNLRVEAVNLRLDAEGEEGPALVVDDPTDPAFLVFTFPPQSIHESAYFMASIVKPATDPKDYTRPDQDASAPPSTIEQQDPPGQPQSPRKTSAQLARPSRLVFTVKPGARVPYSVEGLLDWSKLELSVSPIAAIGRDPTPEQIGSAPDIRRPAATETALELPYHLIISPNRDVVWSHRTGLLTTRGRTELWHTRLQLKGEDGGEAQELTSERRAPLRAIWSPDYGPTHPPAPALKDPDLDRTAMSPNDRHQLVILTSAFHGYEVDLELGAFQARAVDAFVARAPLDAARRFKTKVTAPYLPRPFEAEELMLTPLGGWLNSRGQWDPPRTIKPRVNPLLEFDRIFARLPEARLRPRDLLIVRPPVDNELIIQRPRPDESLDLSEWVHVATQGRDHYVKIVYEGELLPFCNKAALIKVTERMFLEQPSGVVGAYLIQRMFIAVRKPEVHFPVALRGMPLKRVVLKTTQTPDIADPVLVPEDKTPKTNRSFWVETLTGPPPAPRSLFMFNAVGFDVHDEPVDFSIPMMFVSKMDYENEAMMGLAAAEYNDPKNFKRRRAVVGGKKLWFAPLDPLKPNENTRYVAKTINFVVGPTGCPPRMLASDVRFPQVAELLGTDGSATIAFYEPYVAGGFDAQSGVFARVVNADDPFKGLVDAALGVEFSSDQAGGFSTPNMAITTLTRAHGPVAGKVEDAVANKFDPAQFFKKGVAQLFGSFDLADLFLKDSPIDQNAPKLHTERAGDKVVTRLEWQPQIRDPRPDGIVAGDDKVAAFRKDFKGPSVLDIRGLIERPVKPAGAGAPAADDAKFEFEGRLTNFTVSVVNRSVTVNFAEFNFRARKNEKTDVQVKLDPETPIVFGGDLKFVEELRNAIPPGLFGTGPFLELLTNPLGIRAGFAFALPPVTVGVFALKDVSLGAALTLPFLDGKPTFDFNVSERAHPFLLAVAIFGGGGFFHLQLDTAGIRMLEAAFEFGATAALDIGVASGEVHIMAGIYYAMQRKDPGNVMVATLSGYLRMGGSLSVLGIVKISVEFVLSFTYDGLRDKAYGRATLTVRVEILFFSMSVELTVERAFGGSGDPKFKELVNTPEAWSEYALAFA